MNVCSEYRTCYLLQGLVEQWLHYLGGQIELLLYELKIYHPGICFKIMIVNRMYLPYVPSSLKNLNVIVMNYYLSFQLCESPSDVYQYRVV